MMWNREVINPPEKVLKSTNEYRCDMHRMKQFIDGCCLSKEESYIYNNRLLLLYNEWSGENIHPSKFGVKYKERAERLGLKKIRRNYGVFWYGIGEACNNP
jgi:phage/plasmid-associated DNA primase